jgi:hypothetical protein
VYGAEHAPPARCSVYADPNLLTVVILFLKKKIRKFKNTRVVPAMITRDQLTDQDLQGGDDKI